MNLKACVKAITSNSQPRIIRVDDITKMYSHTNRSRYHMRRSSVLQFTNSHSLLFAEQNYDNDSLNWNYLTGSLSRLRRASSSSVSIVSRGSTESPKPSETQTIKNGNSPNKSKSLVICITLPLGYKPLSELTAVTVWIKQGWCPIYKESPWPNER